MAPIEVTFQNQKEIFETLYGSQAPPSDCNFRVGDIIRIPLPKNIFTKGYKAGWTKELYKVNKVFKSGRVFYYNIQNLAGEVLDRKFYNQEINLVVRNGISTTG
jgi:hypothetical protein